MSHWPSGVAIVAIRNRGHAEAITVNSFISASLEPALILISIGNNAFILPNLDLESAFSVNALHAGQARIASMVVDRVPDLRRLFDDGDPPLLRDAMFTLNCTVHAQHPVGDHVLVVGRVNEVRIGNDDAPLLYLEGRYRSIT